MSQVKVTLGEHEYVVHPQRHAYLRHRLGKQIETLGDAELAGDGANLLDQVLDKAYEFLSTFIPELMPQWEFEGYGTPSAYENREYDEAADRSPSPGQIIDAFEAALRVNRLDLVKHLKAWVGEEYLRAQVQVMIGEMTMRSLDASPSSPSANGESASGSSTTPEQPQTLNGDARETTASPSSDSPSS